MRKLEIAIVGATGLVGQKFIKVIEERKSFKDAGFTLYASAKSAGKALMVFGKEYKVVELSEKNIAEIKADIALFSAGGEVSRLFAPVFAKKGTIVIDNSSCFRMDSDVPLVVPEVNPEDIAEAFSKRKIIANPNCSTIQAVVPLKPLNDKFKIKRIVYNTYQAVSGAGVKGIDDLNNGAKGFPPSKFPHPIYNNVLPQIDSFCDNGYTKEEMKMINETRKILHCPSLAVTATAVRVPVLNCHSISVNAEFEKPFTLDEIYAALRAAKGIKVTDPYPMPLTADETDSVYVGRIRKDESRENSLNLWIVADNLRKGAATNAVQIAELAVGNLEKLKIIKN
jgi:aspartate-semialdehyde dehydrogenase